MLTNKICSIEQFKENEYSKPDVDTYMCECMIEQQKVSEIKKENACSIPLMLNCLHQVFGWLIDYLCNLIIHDCTDIS